MSQLSFANMQLTNTEEPSLHLASVVIPPLEGEYLYSFESSRHPSLSMGSIVTVPLARRSTSGFVISVDSEREHRARIDMAQRNIRIRSILNDSEAIQAFDSKQLEFFEWVSKYYAEPLSQILDLAIPTPAVERIDPMVRIVTQPTALKLGRSQKRVVDYLISQDCWTPASTVKEICQVAPATIASLIKKGAIEQQLSPPQSALESPNWSELSRWEALTEEQHSVAKDICSSIMASEFRSFLLHGVTGSGKTEVYLEAIIETLKLGKSALIMVPEIALTPQLTERFEARLGRRVAVLHSSIKPRERWSHWTDLLSGRSRVIIGARSALFAPAVNLGLVIIDEEHDSSLKQNEGIRYHARDLAIVRAKISKCPVVLGSATPSLETYYNAKTGKHSYHTLSRRFFTSNSLKFEIIDLSALKPWEMPSKSISHRFLHGVKAAIQRGDQAFVLYNRRGFASYLQCNKCEHVLGCPHCSVTLTYHRKPACGAHETEELFAQRGSGTERVHEELSQLLPSARIAKLDRDVAASLEDYKEILRNLRERKIDILVGTQMIAKGHDLPDVTFVGVVDCDVGLHLPDFRAAERAFQLLTQVSGRAGRRKDQGFVMLQTRIPKHTSLQMTLSGDYAKFAEIELKQRQEMSYPPFQKLLRIIISAEDACLTKQSSVTIAAQAQILASSLGISMLGPAPAPIEKIRNMWRYHILFKATSTSSLQHLMKKMKENYELSKHVRIVFDIDPQDML
jgi:primosomal protein N' (replication factor Y)